MAFRWLSAAAMMAVLLGPGCGFLGDILGTSEKSGTPPVARAKPIPAHSVTQTSQQPPKGSAILEAIFPDEVIKTDGFRYIAVEKRDPFRPFIILAKVPGKPLMPPLQRYDVAQLRLVGIIMGEKSGRAMVEDASGKGYVVSRGTRVGRRNGVVVRIEKNCLIVEEQYKDSAGNFKSKEVSMKLHRVEGEGT